MNHRLERLSSIPELAAEVGVSPATMRRRLLRLHDQHGGGWLFRTNMKDYAVNRSLLETKFPHFFTSRHASKEEVESLREKIRTLEQRQNSLAARFRQASHAWFTRVPTSAN